MPVIVLENDPSLRLAGILLDAAGDAARRAAYADYLRHDVADFEAWASATLADCPGLANTQLVIVNDAAALHAALPNADAVIVESLPIGAAELALAPRLKVVQTFGMLARHVDRHACTRHGVSLLTLRRRINIAVAEHVMALLLAWAKQLPQTSGQVTPARLRAAGHTLRPYDTRHTPNANWGRFAGLRLLHGSRLGLLGLGEIGRETALLARGLGLAVCYFQRHRLAADEEAALGVTYASFDELLASSDVLSLHLPKDAVDVIDAAALARCKPGMLLINTARAGAVNRAALIAALRSGQLGGAALDVHSVEPLPEDDEFLTLDNVILTPHTAGGARTNNLADMAQLLRGLSAALQSGKPAPV